jgi:hypothetical protein
MPDAKPTQAFVPVKEVRNGIIVLKDGGYRGVMMCSSINFALKSEDEQKAIIGGFQTFLNTLDFSVEIVIHSRKMDIRPYLALLNERVAAQTSEMMQIQLREYIAFIQSFMEGSDIMTKTFYIIVPYSPVVLPVGTSVPDIFGGAKKPSASGITSSFEEHRIQLEQRMALVAGGLSGTGLRVAPLQTEEVIELLYKSFNVGEVDGPIQQEIGKA